MRYFWSDKVVAVRDAAVSAGPHTGPRELPRSYPPSVSPFVERIRKLAADLAALIDKHGLPKRTRDALPAGLWDAQQYSQLRKMNARFREFWRRR